MLRRVFHAYATRRTYQKTVLNALKEVENALVAYTQEKERLDLLTQSVASNELSTKMINERYKAGLVPFLNVLDAQRSLYSAQIAEAQQKAEDKYHNGNIFWANSEYRVEGSADKSNAVQ